MKMRKLAGKHVLLGVAVVAVIIGLGIFMGEKPAPAASETVELNANTSMLDNLVALKGKSVTAHLASGQTITGTVNDAKGNLLHLDRLSQREFFDALIAIDRISAIEVKVR